MFSYENNPHTRQYRNMFGRESPVLDTLPVTLTSDLPRQKYSKRKGSRTIQHWGQRKLLLSEIQFLTLIRTCAITSPLVIYAGAAPGSHTEFLSSLFPDFDFILVDPAKFTCKSTPRITLIQDFFTDELARKLLAENSKRKIFFISDIRIGIKEEEVWADHEAQARWVDILSPNLVMAQLKFRLPWDKESVEYLAGDVYLQAWSRVSSTESRLVVRPYKGKVKRKTWDCKEYEEQFYALNNYTRPSCFPHSVVRKDGALDHCFDCTLEIHILSEYLKTKDPQAIAELSLKCDGGIKGKRTLKDSEAAGWVHPPR